MDVVDELLRGKRYHILPGFLSPEEVGQVNKTVYDELGFDPENLSAREWGKDELQQRIWNLFNKGELLCQLPLRKDALEPIQGILGKDCVIGSYAVNCLLPGAPNQPPHVDYPYLDFKNPDNWPQWFSQSNSAKLVLNCQLLIMLNDFTKENGATAILPGSQKNPSWPDEETFWANHIQVEGKAGDAILFSGLLWHCSMTNNSKAVRAAILTLFLPKFVRPMEDMSVGVTEEILATTPGLRKLLGIGIPFPSNFEAKFGHKTDHYEADDDRVGSHMKASDPLECDLYG